jgi:hypothetical protein
MSEDGSGFPPRTWFGKQPVTAFVFFLPAVFIAWSRRRQSVLKTQAKWLSCAKTNANENEG